MKSNQQKQHKQASIHTKATAQLHLLLRRSLCCGAFGLIDECPVDADQLLHKLGVVALDNAGVSRLKRLALKDNGPSCSARGGQCQALTSCTGVGVAVLGLCSGTNYCCYQAWWYIADTTSTAQIAPNPVTPVSGRRGTIVHLLMGLGDQTTSAGVVTQSESIRLLGPDVQTSVWTWKAWPQVVRLLIADGNAHKHVIIGYSCGASAMEYIADTNIPLDLLVAEDPTIWLSTTPIRGNVKQAICFHNTNFLNAVGRASCEAGAGLPASRLTTINTADLHGDVDRDTSIIKTVLNAVDVVVKAP